MATDGWYGPALENFAPSDAGGHLGPVTVGVLHTTESTRFVPAPNSYFGHGNYPHFTVWEDRVWQHISIRKAAKALANRTGGVQTNKEGCIQIEVIGQAANPGWSDKTKATVAALMRWIESQTQIPRACGVTFKAYPASYGANGVRLSAERWVGYAGWLGHQHVPENSHGDPGAIDIGALLGAAPVAPELVGAIKAKYDSLPADVKAAIGKVTTPELGTPDKRGRFNHFEHGSIYWTPQTGAHVVYGAIRQAWAKLGWERDLGYPISDERDGGRGREVHFERGILDWSPTDRVVWLHRPV